MFAFFEQPQACAHDITGRAIAPGPDLGLDEVFKMFAKGKGKSGGVRIITFYSGADIPVFLLNVFVKGDKVNLTQAERNALKKILGRVAQAYRNRSNGHDNSR